MFQLLCTQSVIIIIRKNSRKKCTLHFFCLVGLLLVARKAHTHKAQTRSTCSCFIYFFGLFRICFALKNWNVRMRTERCFNSSFYEYWLLVGMAFFGWQQEQNVFTWEARMIISGSVRTPVHGLRTHLFILLQDDCDNGVVIRKVAVV